MASRYTPTFKRKLVTERTPPKVMPRTQVTLKPSKDPLLDTAFSVYSPAASSSKFTAMSRRSKSSCNIVYNPRVEGFGTPARTRHQTISEPETPEFFAPVSMETPRRLAKSSSDITQMIDEFKADKEAEISNLKVAVRVRPMNVRECSNYRVKNCIEVRNNELTVLNGTSADGLSGKTFTFQYDHVFWSCNVEEPHFADQATVYETLAKPLVDSAFEGYNICLFAYGQTGSGKSYSMMGIDSEDPDKIGPESGIIPRLCDDLFRRIDQLKDNFYAEVEVSYFEIYNEKIHDLLTLSSEDGFINTTDNKQKPPLKVREHPTYGPYVVDLSTHMVDSHSHLQNWIAVGNSQRATAATGMNDKSSRSHAIFNIVLNVTEKTVGSDDKEIKLTKRSKISLVDLAGSERVYHTKATAERLKEGVSINKSLLTLGKVITALAQESRHKTNFVPYRESVLTWLLRENLGGNSRTVMLGTISPANTQMDETLSTLRYACQARTIVNRVKVNEDPHDRVIRELKAEVERLKALSQDYERQKRHSGASALPRKIFIETNSHESEVESLKRQLAETEKKLGSWEEKLARLDEARRKEGKVLKRNGLELKLALEEEQAYLINLSRDMPKSGNLIYLLPKGSTTIGRPSTLCVPDIAISGSHIGNRHCTISNLSSSMYLVPSEHETYVNGKKLSSRHRIYSGDRISLGAPAGPTFRLVNPSCPNANEEDANDDLPNESKLREEIAKELEREKRNEIRRMELEHAQKISECHMKINQMEQELRKLKRQSGISSPSDLTGSEIDIDKIRRALAPYESTLMEEIRETFREIDSELLAQASDKVRRGNEWCRGNSKPIEFKVTRTGDDFGLLSVQVEVTDKSRRVKALWPLQRFDLWYESAISGSDILPLLDSKWSRVDGVAFDAEPDSTPSTPRKAFNALTELGRSIVRSPMQKLRSSLSAASSGSETRARRSLLIENKENILNSMRENSFESEAMLCLIDMQAAAIKLKKLCKKTSAATADASLVMIVDDDEEEVSDRTRGELQREAEQVEKLVHEMNHILSQESANSSRKVRFRGARE